MPSFYQPTRLWSITHDLNLQRTIKDFILLGKIRRLGFPIRLGFDTIWNPIEF